jgi:carboxymethylenebutenolidase
MSWPCRADDFSVEVVRTVLGDVADVLGPLSWARPMFVASVRSNPNLVAMTSCSRNGSTARRTSRAQEPVPRWWVILGCVITSHTVCGRLRARKYFEEGPPVCFEFDALPPLVPADRVISALIGGGAGAEILTLTSADGTRFAAALAECPEPNGGPAVIILPDVRGLYRFYVDLAERFVTAGFHAMAIDYFGRTADARERDDAFDWMAHIMRTTPDQVQTDIAAARDALAERTGASTFVTVGFCFGGAQADLAGANTKLALDAVISFYGTLLPRAFGADNPDFPAPLKRADEIRTRLLALFGGADPGIPPEDIARFDAALTRSEVPHEIHTYPGAPHSFFDRSFEEHAEASADAWRRVLDFLGKVGAGALA